jgi:head-tail adaptor
MKIKKVNKILAVIMLILTLFSVMQPVFAASGNGKWTGGQYASGMKTTDNASGTTGVLIRRLNNLNTGEKRTVFCAEHGLDFKTGATYNGIYYTPTDSKIRKACKVAYLGWYKNNGGYTVDGGILASDMKWVKWDYVFTQQYIWEILGQSNATFINSDEQQGYIDFKNRIDSEIANIEKRPSFNGKTITIDAGETKTITDSNGVLTEYGAIDNTKDGIRFVHEKGSNSMTISVNENTNLENYRISDNTFREWGMIKNGTEDNDTMVYFEFEEKAQNQLYCMSYNDPVTLNFSLKIEALGQLELSKLNTNGDLIDGAIFNVTGVNNFNKDITVTNGKIEIDKLKKGNYFIKEKSSPSGYLLNTDTYKVQIKPNETTKQAIVNDEPTGEITLTKTDKNTGNSNRVDGTSHHGDVNLKGTEYTIYAKEDIYNVKKTIKYFSKDEEIAKFTFDEYGKATVIVTNKITPAKLSVEGSTLKGLPMGSFYAKETYVVEGYMQDTQEHTYTLSYKDMNTPVIKIGDTLKNTVQKAKFEVIKISTNTNTTAPVIANAEFTAILTKYVDYYGSFDEAKKHLDQYSEDEYSIFKTGADGHGVSGLLAYGEYTVYETYTPSDEIETVEPFYIKIDRNSSGVIKEYIENDAPFESYLKMVKIDKNTGKKVTFSNATFKLYRLNENNEWEKVKCKTGLFNTDKWKTDKTGLAVTEDKLKAGTYKIDEIELPTGFLQLEDELTFKINRSNKTLEFDEDYDAYITITVENEQPTGTLKLDKSVAIRQDVDISLIDISDLSKIKFKLTAKEKIIDYADGSTIYEKGQEVGTYNLTKEGKLEVKKLPMGKYELEEIETLDGLILDNTKHEIVFKQEDTKNKVYTNEEKFVNDTTIVEFSKTDITGDKELKGATLTVTDNNGNVIDRWVSGEKTHKIEGLKAGEKYTLKEEIQVDSYVKATDINFTIENTNEGQKITMIDKIVDVTKTDMVNGEEVEGAKLVVTDKEGNEIDKWTSTKEPHHVVGLEEGKTYVLTETTCPYGYEIAESITFTVTTDKETQLIEMKDMPILKSVQVEKIDKDTGEHIKSNKFTFGIFEDEECTKLIKEACANEFEGTALFENLRYGTFYIKELKAPLGYKLSDQVVKIEINADGVFADGVSLEETEGIYSFVYYNSLLPAVQTGNETNYTLLLGIATIAAVGIIGGTILLKHKKNN